MTKKFFRIRYCFRGEGFTEIEAKSKKEAEKLFQEGKWVGNDNPWGEEYQIIEIEE